MRVTRTPVIGCIAQLLRTWIWVCPPPTRTRSWITLARRSRDFIAYVPAQVFVNSMLPSPHPSSSPRERERLRCRRRERGSDLDTLAEKESSIPSPPEGERDCARGRARRVRERSRLAVNSA